MWCPVCREEYRPGITHCPDCDVDLVEELEEENVSIDLTQFGLPADYEFPEDFSPEQIMEAVTAAAIAKAKEDGTWNEEDDETDPTAIDFADEIEQHLISQPKPTLAKQFKSAQTRYEDVKSTAYTFLLIGGAGLIVSVLAILGVLNLPFHGFVLFVMTAMFAIFVIVGIRSAMTVGKLKSAIDQETAKITEITQWYRKEGSSSPLLSELDQTLPQEELYFKKYEIIRGILAEHFPDGEETLLNKLADDFCEETY